MTPRRCVSMLGVALTVAASSPSALGQARTLQHDPFARPILGTLAPAATPGAPARRVQGALAPKAKINLQAVLVAGPNSIANVDGVLVRVGESVHGYRLLAVQDRSAVFEKNNAKFTLSVGTNGRPQDPAAPAGGTSAQPRLQRAGGEAK
jgi:hypothetical protein